MIKRVFIILLLFNIIFYFFSGPDMAVEDRDRYEIRDNVLIIRNVRKDRDQGMYQCKAYNELDTR